MQLTAAASTSRGGATETGRFYAGEFRVTQTRAHSDLKGGAVVGVTVLTLAGPRPTGCSPVRTASRESTATAGAARAKPKTTARSLWGNAHGNFQTVGTNASATVRGTEWLTEDTCTGTLVRVSRGVVSVTDFRTHKTVLVTAGHSFTAGRSAATGSEPVLGDAAPDSTGFGRAHPALIATSGVINGQIARDVHWEHWGVPQATGSGTGLWLPPNAKSFSQAQPAKVQLVAYDLGTCKGKAAYLKLDAFFPEHGGRFIASQAISTCF